MNDSEKVGEMIGQAWAILDAARSIAYGHGEGWEGIASLLDEAMEATKNAAKG